MPAMTLEYVMNQAGVDTSGPNFDTTVQFDVMVGAFEGNNAWDYCPMFEPTASEFQAASGFLATRKEPSRWVNCPNITG